MGKDWKQGAILESENRFWGRCFWTRKIEFVPFDNKRKQSDPNEGEREGGNRNDGRKKKSIQNEFFCLFFSRFSTNPLSGIIRKKDSIRIEKTAAVVALDPKTMVE